jgi:hypothetical protein
MINYTTFLRAGCYFFACPATVVCQRAANDNTKFGGQRDGRSREEI